MCEKKLTDWCLLSKEAYFDTIIIRCCSNCCILILHTSKHVQLSQQKILLIFFILSYILLTLTFYYYNFSLKDIRIPFEVLASMQPPQVSRPLSLVTRKRNSMNTALVLMNFYQATGLISSYSNLLQ